MSEFSSEGAEERRPVIADGAKGSGPSAAVKRIELSAAAATAAIEPLEYGRRKPKNWYPLSVLFCVFPAGGTILIILAFIVPRFRALFHDFKTEIPGSTKLLMGVSRMVTEDYGWAVGVVVIFLFPLVVGFCCGGKPLTPRAKRSVWVGSMTAAVLFVLWGVWGLYVPMVNL